VESLPLSEIVEGVHVISPPELIARKVISANSRRGQPKAGTDWRDIAMLLLRFPALKEESGAVSGALKTLGATAEEMKTWRDLVAQEIIVPNDDDEFN
jgi:hypothetical protein